MPSLKSGAMKDSKLREASSTVAGHLIRRLEELGVGHVFGVPGDYALNFLDRLVNSRIAYVGACNELNAGYAADGYARVKGVGAAVVTYGVGGCSILNAVAGAFAEQIPLVVVSGSPSAALRRSHALVHHLTSDYNMQYDIFKRVTVDSTILLDAASAPQEIDRVLGSCVSAKRPVYIELPSDMVDAPCPAPSAPLAAPSRASDPDDLAEAVAEAAKMLDAANDPVVLIGVEVKRFNLAEKVESLVERVEIPYATTISSKAVLPELHPQFIGVYQGKFCPEEVRERVENSDCVLSLGVWMTDFVTGGFSAKIDESRLISSNSETLRVKRHCYDKVWMGDFIPALAEALRPRDFKPRRMTAYPPMRCSGFPAKGAALTAARLYERVGAMLDDSMILMADPGDAICGAAGFYIQEADNFVAQAYYMSIGFCLPAALGVSLAAPEKRVVALTGDGAFQMSAQELSTIMRERRNPIVIVVNNKGYLIERLLHTDGPYNDIQNWSYHKLPGVFGTEAAGFAASTEDEFENALMQALGDNSKAFLIEARLEQTDCSPLLRALGEKFKNLQAGGK